MLRKFFAIILFGSIFLFSLSLPKGFVVLAAGLVNINTADVIELDTLPGIGPSKAQAIIDYRTQNGPFQKIEDIMNVSGIGQVTFDNMKALITVGTAENTPTSTSIATQTPPPSSQTNNSEIIETQKEVLGYEVGSVVMNELVSDPADGEVEFVELYNTTIYSVDLENWWIEEGSGKKTLLSYNLPANGFFVVEKPKGSLNNDGDIVKLFDPAGGLIDQLSYGNWDDGNKNNNAPRADDPYALARIFDGQDSDEDIKDFVLTKKITKGVSNVIESDKKETSTPSVMIQSTESSSSTEKTVKKDLSEKAASSTENNFVWTLQISEFIPNPEGADSAEFIEIYNYGDKEINLSGLKIDDDDGGSRPFVLSDIIIKPQEYLAFPAWETKISLNNNGDAVRILDKNNEVIDDIFYEDAIEGASYVQVDGKWSWTNTLTPGKKNIIKEIKQVVKINSSVAVKNLGEVDLSDVREKEVGQKVKVSGVVTVLPNVFGSQYFYIGNEESGVQIYMYKKDFPELKIGDKVTVSGEISQAYGEKRIKTSGKMDIVKIGEEGFFDPIIIKTGEVENYYGALVSIDGEVTEIKSGYMYVDDGDGEIKVYFKNNTGINKNEFKIGEKVSVTGILIERESGVQLQPRSKSDLKKISDEENIISAADNNHPNVAAEKYLTTTAVGLSTILVGLFARARGFFLLQFAKRASVVALSFVKKK